tara:strand:- start:427 stop:1233 length:807 start_codon:yes stop_codon:yes gene_type:complete
MNNKLKLSSRVQSNPSLGQAISCPEVVDETKMPKQWTSSQTISTRTRYGIIKENILDGITFLNEQDRLLAFAGQLLDELRSMPRFQVGETALRARILLRGLADIPAARYKNIALFGNGAESPLKIHVLNDGQRQVIEFEQANLSQPGFQSILQACPATARHKFLFPQALAAKTIGEILNLRVRNKSQTQSLEKQLQRVEDKIAQSAHCRRQLFAGNPRQSPSERRRISSRITRIIMKVKAIFCRGFRSFRSHEPVWEEISTAPSTSNL